MALTAGQPFTFPIRGDKFSVNVEVREVLHRSQSEFQLIEVVDTLCFGRMLLLDGHIQLTELDERAYHEFLVHPCLLSTRDPKRALVVGGGDGGVLRELLKHPGLEIDMVEIDMGVVDASRAQLPFLNEGCFEDPRVNLYVQDAFPFVKEDRGPYDLVVMDSTDTYEGEEGELSARLFTQEFYQDIARLLTLDGFVITQADNLLFCPYSLREIQRELGRVFPETGSYWTFVPSFGGCSGYCWASHGARLAESWPGDRGLDLRVLNSENYALGNRPIPFTQVDAAP